MKPDPVLCILIYVLIGSLVWLLLVHVGAIGGAFDLKRRVSMFWAIGATLLSILIWPLYAWITWRHRKEVWGKFKQIVWGPAR